MTSSIIGGDVKFSIKVEFFQKREESTFQFRLQRNKMIHFDVEYNK